MLMKEENKIKGGNPFRVPEEYFGELGSRLNSIPGTVGKIESKDKPVFRLRPFLLAAASAALLFVAGYAVMKTVAHSENKGAGLQSASAVYDSVYMNEFDIATLEENLASNTSLEQAGTIPGNEIIDFLISDDISILEITEQL